jgi:hypothetical protein
MLTRSVILLLTVMLASPLVGGDPTLFTFVHLSDMHGSGVHGPCAGPG